MLGHLEDRLIKVSRAVFQLPESLKGKGLNQKDDFSDVEFVECLQPLFFLVFEWVAKSGSKTDD
jgi:hypothetical protein